MLLDRQTNVALSILLALAERQDQALPARGLARVVGVSIRSLARLLLQLRQAGLVAMRRGRGYVLARSPWSISIRDVVEACGAPAPAFDPRIADDEGLRAGLERLNERLDLALSRTVLAHVAAPVIAGRGF